MTLETIFLYRITHIDNIPHVLDFGVTHKNSVNANPAFRSIGDVSLINTRNRKRVRVDNGDLFSEQAVSITLGDFIPFYFGVRMPMLYVIQHGGNFVQTKTEATEIVYIACSLKKIIDLGLPFYFTDGHATDNLTTFYSPDHVEQLPNIVDWKAVKSSYWSGEENLNIKRKKQAEFLAQADIPIDCIRGYGVYDDQAKQKMINFGIDEAIIKVIPQSYY
jgi:hypothetical protein